MFGVGWGRRTWGKGGAHLRIVVCSDPQAFPSQIGIARAVEKGRPGMPPPLQGGDAGGPCLP
jgi:hypothetical protein